MTNRIQRFIAFLLVLCIPIFAIAGCTNNDVANAANQVTTNANGTYSIDTKTTTPEGKLDVYMLDIGQGDAILLKVGDEYSMIDTGDIEHRENIVAQLKAMGVTKLKNIIITHPHADHMGGFYAIAKAMPIEHVYDDGIAVDNNMYKTYEKWIEKNKIFVHLFLKVVGIQRAKPLAHAAAGGTLSFKRILENLKTFCK